jgi:mannose-6-phosphate isomerase-like protein (cupin superfamily)
MCTDVHKTNKQQTKNKHQNKEQYYVIKGTIKFPMKEKIFVIKIVEVLDVRK